MARQYVWIRIRKEDYERMIQTKRIPMEEDIQKIIGKKIKIKNTQLMNIAANSVWDLGNNYQGRLFNAIRVKRGDLRL